MVIQKNGSFLLIKMALSNTKTQDDLLQNKLYRTERVEIGNPVARSVIS